MSRAPSKSVAAAGRCASTTMDVKNPATQTAGIENKQAAIVLFQLCQNARRMEPSF
jgi:hypothetical protein